MADKQLSIDEWNSMWTTGFTKFHMEDVNEALMRYYNRIQNGREKIKTFVPLCGKSLDMKWLFDQGNTVIGVETSEIAIKDFFKEHNVKYTVVDVPEVKGKLYKSEDNRFRLYCCDFFLFNSKLEGCMDIIWDRGSLVAINREDRTRYAELMKSLLTPGCQYLLETARYDENKYSGPPFNVPDEQVMELFGDRMHIEQLEAIDYTSKIPDNWGLDKFDAVIHLMSTK